MSQTIKRLNISKNDLDELIANELKHEEVLPTDWTTERMMTEHGVDRQVARRILEKMVKQGKAVKLPGKDANNRNIYIYRGVVKK